VGSPATRGVPASTAGRKALADPTIFPVLPTPRAMPPEAPAAMAPPPWATPRPVPTGPRATVVDSPSTRRRIRRSFATYAALGVLAAAALLAVTLLLVPSSREAPLADVRTVTAAPTKVLRYFDGAAMVEVIPPVTLEFPTSGKVSHMAHAGSKVAVGEVVAAVEIARRLQTQLTRQRERLAFYQQMAEAMHQVGNTKEEERQVSKVQVRSASIAKTLRELADVAVIATRAGVVDEVFAHEGDTVQAKAPALRLRSLGVRVAFDLPRELVARARRLGFCQVDVEGYVLDCVQTETDAQRVEVELANVPQQLIGKPARLARARFEGATVVPLSAVARSGNRSELRLLSPRGRVELRPVTVADEADGEAVVVQGLDAGDTIIVAPTSGQRAASPTGS
jgi:hypothetical protein